MKKCQVAAVDIGGTNIRAATFSVSDGRFKVVDRAHQLTSNYLTKDFQSAQSSLDAVVDFVTNYALHAVRQYNIDILAAAFPGPVKDNAKIMALPTIWGAAGATLCPIDLNLLLADRLPMIAVHVMNDVTAAGYRFIAEENDFAIFTLGSGVGLKVFIGRKPCLGPNFMGG
jgi:glucokinase